MRHGSAARVPGRKASDILGFSRSEASWSRGVIVPLCSVSGILSLAVASQYKTDMDKQEAVQGGLSREKRRLSGDLFSLLLQKKK